MTTIDTICLWCADIVLLVAMTASFIYGVRSFFKKGKAFYLQIVTMAMGCYAMGSFYHLCQSLTSTEIVEGFTAAYLGKIGFFLFLFTANFGQMDSLIDDGSKAMRKSRLIALAAPVAAIIILIPCIVVEMPLSTKITMTLVWTSAVFSTYYNLKHAVAPDMGYGFVKAIRPYNISALIMSFVELILLFFWAYYDIDYGFVIIAFWSVVLSIMSVVTMVMLKRGVERWKM